MQRNKESNSCQTRIHSSNQATRHTGNREPTYTTTRFLIQNPIPYAIRVFFFNPFFAYISSFASARRSRARVKWDAISTTFCLSLSLWLISRARVLFRAFFVRVRNVGGVRRANNGAAVEVFTIEAARYGWGIWS